MRAADPQDFRCAHFVSPDVVEHTLGVPAFELIDGHQNLVVRVGSCGLILYTLRQIAHINYIRFSHHAGMFDDVLQLSNIAWPGIPREHGLRASRETGHSLVVLSGKSFQEMALEQWQILGPFRE